MVTTGRRGKLVTVVTVETVPTAIQIEASKYCYRYGCANRLLVMVTMCTRCLQNDGQKIGLPGVYFPNPVLCRWNALPGDYQLFPALKQSLGGRRFKDDRQMETVLTR